MYNTPLGDHLLKAHMEERLREAKHARSLRVRVARPRRWTFALLRKRREAGAEAAGPLAAMPAALPVLPVQSGERLGLEPTPVEAPGGLSPAT